MNFEEFLDLSSGDAAKVIRASGSKVVVFPINGTRRWFAIDHSNREVDDPITAYIDITMQRHIELYKLFLIRDADTLLTTVIESEILDPRCVFQ